MPITLNHSNISVQYSSDKSYIIETVKSDLYRRNELIDTITRDNLQTAPVTPSMYIENGTNNVYAVESYTYSGTANTADFTRVFTKSTTCDILIVGGGGAGGTYIGGGGGGGGVLHIENANISAGTYNIQVGKGGTGVTGGASGTTAQNGSSSKAFGIEVFGGGYGGVGQWGTSAVQQAGANGGSGGGGGSCYTGTAVLGGTVIQPSFTSSVITANNYTYYGGNGASGLLFNNNSYGAIGANGGGGAGGNAPANTDQLNAGAGADGIAINITGTSYFWGGGGGGGLYGGTYNGKAGNGGKGGGGGGSGSQQPEGVGIGGIGGITIGQDGDLEGDGTPTAGNGGAGTGGGGGGCGRTTASPNAVSGSGGSGIVIIRYLLGTIPSNNLLTNANEPTITSPTFTETIRTFTHSGGAETQTTHTITIARDTICDILIVGGGGSGDRQIGGGGGGGAVLYATNITIPPGSYTIRVGKGGENGNGGNSEAFGATCLGGGSTPFVGWGNPNNGTAGGSGSGGSSGSTGTTGTGGGVGTSTKGTLLSSGTLYNGNIGGNGLTQAIPVYNVVAGGGGGAGTAGFNSSSTQYTTRSSWLAGGSPSKGGDGIQINITGTAYYWGAGGGGGGIVTHAGDGGLGGGGGGGSEISGGTTYPAGLAGTGGINSGGNGLITGTQNGGNGGAGTGSGGGGGAYNGGSATNNGGNGGSGIVIIKFKSTTAILDGITHKRLNFAYTQNYPFIQADNTNLKAWYKFDGNYMDSSPSGFNLTNSGATIVDGLIVQSLSTDASDFLETSGINLNGKTYSISFWAKFNTAPSGYIPLFTQGVSDSLSARVIFLYEPANILRFSHYGSGNDIDTSGYNISSMVGTSWHHYVITYNNTNRGAEIWIDGVKLNTNVSTLTNTFTGSGNFTIARWSSLGVTFNGLMEDFRYYDKILTSAEISQLYNIPTTNQYTINFPVPTIADINNNSNIVLRGSYDIALSTSNAVIIPKEGQHIHNPSVLIRDSSERIYPPVRNFTSDTTIISGQLYGNGTYIVSASTFFIGEETFRVFNGTNSGWTQSTAKYDGSPAGTYTGLLSLGGFTGEWIKVQLPVSIKLTRYIIEASSIGGVNRAPSVYKIFGSNNNIDWEQVVYKSVPLVSADYISSKYEEKVSSNNYYRFFALVIGKNMGLDSWLGIGEWYIYGKEFSNNSLSIRYNILNPILDPIGAQWTYSSSNTNVYHMGSVGIGTTRPEYQLDVRGAIYSSVGGYTQTGLTTWTVTSDKRIKDNIVRASYDKCLENVKNIELYNFNFKNNCINTNDKHQLGFIAQEVQQVYPKAVEVGKIILNTNEAIDDILTLNTTQIDYTLYGAVKNLIEKIEDIDNDLENIEKAVGMGEPAPNAGN
jgi:hypothetical protein